MRSPSPLSLDVVEQNLAELSAELSQASSDLYGASRRAATARHAYRVAHARAFLAAKGTEKARDAQATLDAADELHARELECAVEDSLKVSCSNLRAQLSGMQSLANGLRAAVVHATGVGA